MDFEKKILTWSTLKSEKTVVATGIGNAMEWFDFGVYAYTTAYIGANFSLQSTILKFSKYLHLLHYDSILT